MIYKLAKKELLQAQAVLFIAIALQLIVWRTNKDIFGPQYTIILIEIVLALTIGLTSGVEKLRQNGVHHGLAIGLLGLLSIANITSLIIVLHSLVVTHLIPTGLQLLTSALAIFATNIIVFALWYWEIDSPGLTRRRWSRNEKDFQFIQQDRPEEFKDWKPEFFDYLYLSVTNGLNFAPADTRPLTHQAKLLMGLQAAVSMLTLALVIARSVGILGQ